MYVTVVVFIKVLDKRIRINNIQKSGLTYLTLTGILTVRMADLDRIFFKSVIAL